MLAEDVKLAIKDSLRAAREMVRSANHLVPLIPHPLTDVADGVLTRTETAVRALAGRSDGAAALDRALADLASAGPRRMSPAAFRSAIYRIMSGCLAGRGTRSVVVSETAIAAALQPVDLQEGDDARLAAAVALALLAARPIRVLPAAGPARAERDLDVDAAVVTGLVVAVAAGLGDRASASDVLAASLLAVDACEDQVAAALAAGDPGAALAAFYAGVAPHLP